MFFIFINFTLSHCALTLLDEFKYPMFDFDDNLLSTDTKIEVWLKDSEVSGSNFSFAAPQPHKKLELEFLKIKYFDVDLISINFSPRVKALLRARCTHSGPCAA